MVKPSIPVGFCGLDTPQRRQFIHPSHSALGSAAETRSKGNTESMLRRICGRPKGWLKYPKMLIVHDLTVTN